MIAGECSRDRRVAHEDEEFVCRRCRRQYRRLTWLGDRFEGGTVGQGCESTLMGATYASSQVVLRAEGSSSWDRGFDASGRRVWGATAGPCRFERRSTLDP